MLEKIHPHFEKLFYKFQANKKETAGIKLLAEFSIFHLLI